MCDRRFRSSGYKLEGAEHRGAKPSECAKVSLRLRGEGDREEKRDQTKTHWFMRMGGGWEDKVYRRVRGKMEARGKEYGRIIWIVCIYLARTSQSAGSVKNTCGLHSPSSTSGQLASNVER
ncbi:hypothetical protein M405DRAFT_824131 [Rhizopogon salebrosus TDB-379]|nr:hypothetical protein M405DRAFT_824131 [Rhizopogon salebrosus TDB-379]